MLDTHDSTSDEGQRPPVIPPGHEGADSGATDSVRVDSEGGRTPDEEDFPSDTAGVKPRDGADDDPGDLEQEKRLAEPDGPRDDEADGVAHHLDRVTRRDAENPGRAVDDAGTQHRPRLAQNAASEEEELEGIIAQSRADLSEGSPERIVELLRQRLDDAGIARDDDQIVELARRVSTRD